MPQLVASCEGRYERFYATPRGAILSDLKSIREAWYNANGVCGLADQDAAALGTILVVSDWKVKLVAQLL